MKLMFALSTILLMSTNCFSADQKKIKVAGSTALTTAGLYLAIERGYFKQSELDVELDLVQGSGAPLTLLLQEEKIQVAAASLTAGLFNALAKGGIKLVADKGHVSEKTDYIALLVRKDLFESQKIKSIADLKGRKIAMTSLDGVSQQIVLEKMLKSAGLSFKDVELLKLSYPEMNLALKTKSIDAALQLEPYLTKATIENDAIILHKSNQFLPDQQSAALIFSKDFIEKSRPNAIRFLKAYLKGVNDYNKAIEDKSLWPNVVRDLKPYIKVEDLRIWAKVQPVGLRTNGSLNQKSIQADIDWYKLNAFLKIELQATAVVDQKILTEAQAP